MQDGTRSLAVALQRLKAQAEAGGLPKSLRQMAEAVHYNRTSLGKVFDGRVVPEPEVLERIVRYLGGSMADLPTSSAVDGHDQEVPASPPPPGLCVGRDLLVERVVSYLTDKDLPARLTVLGPSGVGKTKVVLAALDRPEVRERYGARRWFVDCTGLKNPQDVHRRLAQALRLKTQGRDGYLLVERICKRLGPEPAVLVLDNLEDPWSGDSADSTEQLLASLAAIADLRLAVTLRGYNRPNHVLWTEGIVVPTLTTENSRALFLAIAGKEYAEHEDLPHLLAKLDDMPLAIRVVASHVRSVGVSELVRRWDIERKRIYGAPNHGASPSRETSVVVSIQLSLTSPQMTEAGHRLLRLLGQLPDGIAISDLWELMPDDASEAQSAVVSTGLAELRPAPPEEPERVACLAPVREYLADEHPPWPSELRCLVRYYSSLAHDAGEQVGASPAGEAAADRIVGEVGNITYLLGCALRLNDDDSLVVAAAGLTTFSRFSGGAMPGLSRDTLIAVADRLEPADRATVLESLGALDLDRSHYAEARARHQEAFPLYRSAGDEHRHAICLARLGDIALAQTEYDAAVDYYRKAHAIFGGAVAPDALGLANVMMRLGDVATARCDHDTALREYTGAFERYGALRPPNSRGLANCIKRFGDIYYVRGEIMRARNYYRCAHEMYRENGSLRGEMNCVRRLADVAQSTFEDAAAGALYTQAMPGLEQIGDALGVGNIEKRQADLALRRNDLISARKGYRRAALSYEENHHRLGVANCLRGLAEADRVQGRTESAVTRFEEAIPLYREVGNRRGEGNCRLRLGDLAFRAGHRCEAARLYQAALAVFDTTGHTLGRANCQRRLADLAWMDGNRRAAQSGYEQALTFYLQICEPFSVAWTLARIARVRRLAPGTEVLLDAYAGWSNLYRTDWVTMWHAEDLDRTEDLRQTVESIRADMVVEDVTIDGMCGIF